MLTCIYTHRMTFSRIVPNFHYPQNVAHNRYFELNEIQKDERTRKETVSPDCLYRATM